MTPRVRRCCVCGIPYTKDPKLAHLLPDELEEMLEKEKGETGHVSHGVCPDCAKRDPKEWGSGSGKVKLVNEITGRP